VQNLALILPFVMPESRQIPYEVWGKVFEALVLSGLEDGPCGRLVTPLLRVCKEWMVRLFCSHVSGYLEPANTLVRSGCCHAFRIPSYIHYEEIIVRGTYWSSPFENPAHL
jgi:hypothetical protein